MAPAIIAVPGKGRVLVVACGSDTSGIPAVWGAAADRPGVHLLPDLSAGSADSLSCRIRQLKRPGDVTVVSIHWGANWDYEIPAEQIAFAHRLVEGGVDIVHGHSSHHVKGLEVYRERLILYGCGDFLDDYEGIGGYEAFRPELRLMVLPHVDPRQGRLTAVRLVPMRMRRFRLQLAAAADAAWCAELLNGLGAPFGTRVQLEPDHCLTVRWR